MALDWKIIEDAKQEDLPRLIQRPYQQNLNIRTAVEETLRRVRSEGDAVLLHEAQQWDGLVGNDFTVAEEEWSEAANISQELRDAIDLAFKNIWAFHEAQKMAELHTEPMSGLHLRRKAVPIQRVGLYVPGGSAPLFSSLLMLGIPAVLAGCPEIVVCTPSQGGKLHPAILYTAKKLGIRRIYKVGGAAAIAAMAYGTQSIPSVYKIFGPGNQWVTEAKAQVQRDGIAIDMPAGPSEVLVLADETANPIFVAADLLSQAEHGGDSQCLLVSSSQQLAEDVLAEVVKQLTGLSRSKIASEALSNSFALVVNDMEEGLAFSNLYAPEHLIINAANAETLAWGVTAAGSVFVGEWAPESCGDYASGTNHTLPTNGAARAYSGVSLDSFQNKVTFQTLTAEALQSIGPAVISMANAEGLQAHAAAVALRLEKIEGSNHS